MITGPIEGEWHVRFRVRAMAFVALTILAVVFVFSMPARSDSPSYFDFADQRTLLGVPRFMDVVSSVPWAIIGIAGLLFAWHRRAGPDGPFTESWERMGSMIMFAAILGVSVGSAYFHYAPGPPTLFWDRLPMAVAFTSFF